MIEAFDRQDERLTEEGFPPTSPWWHATVARFYRSGRKSLVARVGRRGGKSSTLCRLAVNEALHGAHRIPPGDTGFVAFVSVKRGEAMARLRTISAILDALHVPYSQTGDTITLSDRPIAFRVFTASVAGVSGPTCICAICDEVSKWRDADTGANPATEVLASLRPTMATMPNARMVLSSSPLGLFDAHAKAFELGDTDEQIVAAAPTWVANPTVSEVFTRELEPDEEIWKREYAAIPTETAESGLLSAPLLDTCTLRGVTEMPRLEGHTYVAAMDPATRGNAWTLCVGTTSLAKVKTIVLARQWRGSPAKPLDPDVVLGEISQILYGYGVDVVQSDSWSGDALMSIARRHRLRLVLGGDPEYENMKDKMQDGAVHVVDVPELRADLLSIRRRITPTGAGIALATTPDGRHSDFAPSCGARHRYALRSADHRPAGGCGEAPSSERNRAVRCQEKGPVLEARSAMSEKLAAVDAAGDQMIIDFEAEARAWLQARDSDYRVSDVTSLAAKFREVDARARANK